MEKRFGQSVLTFKDPHGTSLALVGTPNAESEPAWTVDGIPAEHADPRPGGRHAPRRERRAHGRDPDRRVRLQRDGPGRLPRPLQDGCPHRRHRRHPQRRRLPAGPDGRRLRASRGLPREGRCRPGRDGEEARARRMASRPRSRRTATTSGPSISGSRAASSSRSPPTSRVLRRTSRRTAWARP